jgi:histidyl-tRNA synthetase
MKANAKIQSVRGMNDILPAEANAWEAIESLLASHVRLYGYQPVRLPVVEPTPLFHRAIGEVTDIVEKEMYSFTDSLNGEALTLRPEGTAGCVRAVVQNNLMATPGAAQRLYYMGPMFRHERPQKGRSRQFHQFGVESFGLAGPDIDAEHLVMLEAFWRKLGIEGKLELQINSLGEPDERARHRTDLVAYLESHEALLDDDAKRRLHSNPLRVLDSKNPQVQAICEGAPVLLDYLGEASRAHFDGLREVLDGFGIPYAVNPKLVRGLDYYNLTVFEWVTTELGTQGTVCAGGRYDGLVGQLGGKPAPACGFAIGLERLLALVQAEEWPAPQLGAYIVHSGGKAAPVAWEAAERLRLSQVDAVLHCGGGSFKSQLKKADASGASFAVVVGEDEANRRAVQVKALREDAPQREVPLDEVAGYLAEQLFSGFFGDEGDDDDDDDGGNGSAFPHGKEQ